jgi:predicted DNA binding CopG/RHH family protein
LALAAGGWSSDPFGHTLADANVALPAYVVSKHERTRYSRYAKATFRKDRRLNIRLSSKDLEAIQKRALAEGLPYQTLISSLLHKYASGRLKEL